MLERLQARLRYEVTRRTRDRTQHAAAIAAARERAATYCAGLGLDALLEQSLSTGADVTDYYLLHRFVMKHKPALVVEFGSGKSTIVLAHALKQTGGHVVTYEAVPEYYENLLQLIPSELSPTITAICSPREETEFRGVWGVRYAHTPPEGASLFFVDGPTETINGRKGACLDLLFYMERFPATWFAAAIDQKFSSQEAYQSFLPADSVLYDPVTDLGVIAGACGGLLRERNERWRIRHCSAPAVLQL